VPRRVAAGRRARAAENFSRRTAKKCRRAVQGGRQGGIMVRRLCCARLSGRASTHETTREQYDAMRR